MAINSVPGFTIGGKVITAIGPGNDTAYSVLVQSDGKIVLAGNSSNGISSSFALARYNPDGSLDMSFGAGGTTTTSFSFMDFGAGAVLLPDGKILVGGFGDFGGGFDFMLVRYNADGSVDSSFGLNGMVRTSVGDDDSANEIIIQPDGKILLVGSSTQNSDRDFSVVRYNADGSLDLAFGIGGSAKIGAPLALSEGANSVIHLPNGQILLAGFSETLGIRTFALARLHADGSPDFGFAGTGITTTPIGPGNAAVNSIVVQSDGKILAAGFSGFDGDLTVIRYRADGVVDGSFGIGGKVVVPFGFGMDSAESMILQPDGKILVGGLVQNGPNFDFVLLRLNPDGSHDFSFGAAGRTVMPVGQMDDMGFSLALLPDGKILLAGRADGDFGLVRFNANGSLDSAFNLRNTLDATPTFAEDGSAVVLDGDVAVYDAELSSFGAYSGATLTLARAGGANADDVFAASGTLAPFVPGGVISVNGFQIGTVALNSGGTLVLSFGPGATEQLVAQALRQITYANTSDAPPATVDIVWTFFDGNGGQQGTGGVGSTSGTTKVTIVAQDDAATAGNDVFTVGETDGPLAGNVFADNGSGVDFDPDTALAVAAVNGAVAAVGSTITLASGALLRLNADGSFSYDANGVFDWLPASDSGASNLVGVDSFTYTLAGGETATVTITLSGIDSDDTLRGLAGTADTLRGGIGNDVYYVDDANDIVVELAGGGTADRVAARSSYALSADAEVELLTTNSSGSTVALDLKGNSLSQTIVGNMGKNLLHDGGIGPGGAAADTLKGLGGNDTYVIYNSQAVIVELAGQGTDRVASYVDYKLADGVAVEFLNTTSLQATHAVDLTGNRLAQTITGNAGDNVLNDGGKGAADILKGYDGNDTYVVYNAGDTIVEATDQGNDRVSTAVSFVLTAGAEIETLTTTAFGGSGAIDLTGNAFGQAITGNAGANRIDGGGGSDTLRGGGGADTFVFSTALGAGNVDTILDFNAAADTIALDDAVFTTLSAGVLDAGAFHVGSAASTAGHRIVYDNASGALSYDADGNGAGEAVRFATLATGLAMTSADFLVM